MRPVQNGATSAAVAARHLAPGDDLVAQATAALEGVTDGPWTIPGQPDKICAEGYTKNGAAKTIATVCTPSWMGTSEPWANACFIAFTRQWVPEAAARISALTATVAWLQAEREAHHANPADFRYWEGRYRDEAAEAATLRARLARMEGDQERVMRIAAGLFPGGYDNNLATIRAAALTDGGSNG
jgi:hypothetical protein